MPDIIITPNRGTASNPTIQFSGSISSSIRLEVLPEGQIAFLGNSGSLFSISDNLFGSLMSVGDISGLPILEVFSDDKVVMGKYNSNALVVTGSNVGIGKTIPNAKLDISGSVIITGSLASSLDANINGVTVGKGNNSVLTNTAFGLDALKNNTGGTNVAIGYNAMLAPVSAFRGVAVGYFALSSTTSGNGNTAVGYQSLQNNTIGGTNTAVGYQSLFNSISGSANTALGRTSLYNNTSGSFNTAVGNFSLNDNTSGSYNTAIGYNTGFGITTGNYNTILGAQVAGLSSTLSNTIIIADGQGNIRQYIDSSGNMALGKTSPINAKLDISGSVIITGSLQTTGDIYINTVSTGQGVRVGTGNGDISSNTAVGVRALNSITFGSRNVAIGYEAITSGSFVAFNTAVGYQALSSLDDYTEANVAIGDSAMYSTTTGNNSVAVGMGALYSNTEGSSQVAVGMGALYYNSVGNLNVAIGGDALFSNTSGSENAAIGIGSLRANSVGHGNIGIGYYALSDSISGSYNTAIGDNTGLGITSGSYNTILGAQVTGLSATLRNTIILADGQGNIRQYIDSSGNMALGKTSPINAKLDVLGNTTITGSLSVTGNITGTIVAAAPDFSPIFMMMGA